MFDPVGSGTAQSETDGRVYSLITAGSNAMSSTTWASITTDGGTFGQHTASLNASHAGYFQPRTNTIRTSMRFGSFSTIGATFVTADSEPVGVPITIRDVVTSNFVGAARQWYITKDQFSRVTVLSGATTIGYTVAATINTTAGNAIMLRY